MGQVSSWFEYRVLSVHTFIQTWVSLNPRVSARASTIGSIVSVMRRVAAGSGRYPAGVSERGFLIFIWPKSSKVWIYDSAVRSVLRWT